MITLTRTGLSRATGSVMVGKYLEVCAKKEKPFMKPCVRDEYGTEYWNMEKQFWLKYKKDFQLLGFLPMNTWNKTKKIKHMMEKY